MGYIVMCHCEGYDFQAVYSGIGYINQSTYVQNRVSFSRKLINWLKILVYTLQGNPELPLKNIKKIKSANLYLYNSAYSATQDPSGTPHPKIPKVTPPNYKQETKELENQTTILVKTFGTLCVSGEENVIQVDPPPPPLDIRVLGVTSQTLFTYFAYGKDLNFVWGGGGVGEKSCLGHVYECVLQVSCKFHRKTREKGKVSQNLLARIVG